MAIEVAPTALEAPKHIGARHIVPALPDARRDTPQRKPRGGQAQKDNLDIVAGGLPSFQASQVAQSAQGCLESKVRASTGEPIQFCQKEPTSCQSCQFRAQRRKSAGDEV